MAKKTNRMPRSLPILEREDFCKGRLTNGSRHCTVGWMITAQLPRTLAVERVWHQAATEVGIKDGSLTAVYTRNDHPTTTLAKLAEAWNRMVKLLGYTEVVDA